MDAREEVESTAINKATGLAVRVAMLQSGKPVSEVAAAVGMSVTSLYRKLTGRRSFSVPEIVAIAQVLGVDSSTLLRFGDAA